MRQSTAFMSVFRMRFESSLYCKVQHVEVRLDVLCSVLSLSEEIKICFCCFSRISLCLHERERLCTTQPTWIQKKHLNMCRITKALRTENNWSRFSFSCTNWMLMSVCTYSRRACVCVSADVPSCLLMRVCASARLIQKERYLIILCSPIQVIQMI